MCTYVCVWGGGVYTTVLLDYFLDQLERTVIFNLHHHYNSVNIAYNGGYKTSLRITCRPSVYSTEFIGIVNPLIPFCLIYILNIVTRTLSNS